MSLISCSAKSTNTKSDKAEQTTLADTSTTNDDKKADTSDSTDSDTSTTTVDTSLVITEEEATRAIKSMYADYTVKKTKIVDNVIYFHILDKDKQYATVKVDMVTADSYEQNSDNEVTSFNLLG